MTPEGKVKQRVKEILKEYGVYWHCPVQNGMGQPTLDFICCYKGNYVAIEAKGEEKQNLTPRQQRTAKSIEESGGTVLRVDPFNVDRLGKYFEVRLKDTDDS